MNVVATDALVSEYLIYRGFTQTYNVLDVEKKRDKLKNFEINSVVEVCPPSLHAACMNAMILVNFSLLTKF